MASVVISGDTSGTITLSAPAVAGTNTITIPANTGTMITTASSGQIIPKAALPTGSVLQVVNATYGTETSTTSTSYIDTGLTATITPTSSSSKILVEVFQTGIFKGGGDTVVQIRLVRGSTVISNFEYSAAGSGNNNNNYVGASGTTYLDSPATTNATTYKTQFSLNVASGSGAVQKFGSVSSITLYEIAA